MERILSLLPSTTELAAALGLGDRLVGRSHECDVPAEVARLPAVTEARIYPAAPSRVLDERVKALVGAGLSIYRVDAERVRALRPDVILTQTQCEVCAVTPRDLEAALAEWLGAPPRLVAVHPETLDDVLDDFVRVAEGCGVGERGRALRAEQRDRIEAITDRAGRAATRPRVAYLEWIDPLMGAGTWIPELLTRAGGQPVLGHAGGDAAWSSWEALRAADPDAIVIGPCGFDLARTRLELAPRVATPEWPQLRAAGDGRVFLVDGVLHMSRPGPRIAESLEILAELLHPDLFEFGHAGRGWAPL